MHACLYVCMIVCMHACMHAHHCVSDFKLKYMHARLANWCQLTQVTVKED